MAVSENAATSDRFGYGDCVFLGEGGELGSRLRIVNAPSGNDDRPLGIPDQIDCLVELIAARPQAARFVQARLEKAERIVVSFALGVLAKGEAGRAAVGGI